MFISHDAWNAWLYEATLLRCFLWVDLAAKILEASKGPGQASSFTQRSGMVGWLISMENPNLKIPKGNHRKTQENHRKTMGKWWFNGILWGFTIRSFVAQLLKMTIERVLKQWIFPLKMVIFHSYAKLPEGKMDDEIWTVHEVQEIEAMASNMKWRYHELLSIPI